MSLPIHPLHFRKFYLIQKQKTLRKCRYLVKTTFAVYLIFYKLIFFETLVIFIDSTIKLITEIFDLQIFEKQGRLILRGQPFYFLLLYRACNTA